MKNFTTILFLMFAFVLQSHAQENVMPPLGAVWKVGNDGNGYVFKTAEKDTVYNGIACVKIRRTKREFYTNTASELSPYFIYQNGDTVLYYNDFYQRFIPMIVFNTQVGDTVAYPIPFSGSQPPSQWGYVPADSLYRCITDSIKTEVFSGDSLKTYYVHLWFEHGNPYDVDADFAYGTLGNFNDSTYKYTERILTYVDLPRVFKTGAIIEYDNFLYCYHDSSINYVKSQIAGNDIACDAAYTSVPEVRNGATKIVLTPNPAHQYVSVVGMETRNFITVKILSIDGRVIQQSKNVFGNQVANVNNLSAGIYIVELQDAQLRKFMGKILVDR